MSGDTKHEWGEWRAWAPYRQMIPNRVGEYRGRQCRGHEGAPDCYAEDVEERWTDEPSALRAAFDKGARAGVAAGLSFASGAVRRHEHECPECKDTTSLRIQMELRAAAGDEYALGVAAAHDKAVVPAIASLSPEGLPGRPA